MKLIDGMYYRVKVLGKKQWAIMIYSIPFFYSTNGELYTLKVIEKINYENPINPEPDVKE